MNKTLKLGLAYVAGTMTPWIIWFLGSLAHDFKFSRNSVRCYDCYYGACKYLRFKKQS